MPPVPLLSACYFGSVEHYALLARHPRVVIDTGEHYVRQSYRTRTGIVGPNGPQDLSLQVEHGQGRKLPMREVRLSTAETWPQQHLHALRSAYGKAPWCIHYIEDIEAVLLAGYERLVDLDLATMRSGLKWLGLRTELVISDTYCEVADPPLDRTDLRTTLHPKKPLPPQVPAIGPYPQTFADRHGFMPRRSIIDLVMNTGPEALKFLVQP
ncbi:MAG: WbqC family protein [Flavobacteriales bacterium]|nr:WbqC family protein [Flavobacteriales bacterium]